VGKRIDELPLDETPISVRPEDDERHAAWYEFVVEVNDLRESEGYGWAEETLSGIVETVERTKRVSEGQRRAVEHIRDARTGRSRRYDGYTWRR